MNNSNENSNSNTTNHGEADNLRRVSPDWDTPDTGQNFQQNPDQENHTLPYPTTTAQPPNVRVPISISIPNPPIKPSLHTVPKPISNLTQDTKYFKNHFFEIFLNQILTYVKNSKTRL
jgi:hypothetical protein